MKPDPDKASRRLFLKHSLQLVSAAAAAPALLYPGSGQAAAVPTIMGRGKRGIGVLATRPIAVANIPRFQSLLPNPLAPQMLAKPDLGQPASYTLAIRQTQQNLGLSWPGTTQVLTTVWGYGSAGQPATFPGPTFDVMQGTAISVTFTNALVAATGAPLASALPVDTTLDWANPGGLGGLAPVPLTTHLHGGDTVYGSDGLPDAWSTPGDIYTGRLFAKPYRYENTQEAGHLWYHDHALGVTRTNVYMGLSGLYLIRDANEQRLRSGAAPVLPSYPYEVPIVIQDRMFDAGGNLFYPSDTGLPGMPVPSHLPEFFGDVSIVNGKAWPVLKVEPRKYRLRLLNGSDSRFYDLRLRTTNGTAGPPLLVIGNELGFLDKPALPSSNYVGGPVSVLSIGPGERYDVIVDFSRASRGTRYILGNRAAAPYPAGLAITPGTVDQIMAFDVSLPLNTAIPNASVTQTTVLRTALLGPVNPAAVSISAVRRILLLEGTDRFGRLQPMMGTVDNVNGLQGTLTFKDPQTEQPTVGSWEIWEFYNTTVDAHPIHMHLVDFRVLDRQAFTGVVNAKINTDGSTGGYLSQIQLVGAARKPGAWEAGRKDTVQSFPGEVTRVLVNFKRAGEYVYHCHILSHEDHEMMRPYTVV